MEKLGVSKVTKSLNRSQCPFCWLCHVSSHPFDQMSETSDLRLRQVWSALKTLKSKVGFLGELTY